MTTESGGALMGQNTKDHSTRTRFMDKVLLQPQKRMFICMFTCYFFPFFFLFVPYIFIVHFTVYVLHIYVYVYVMFISIFILG